MAVSCLPGPLPVLPVVLACAVGALFGLAMSSATTSLSVAAPTATSQALTTGSRLHREPATRGVSGAVRPPHAVPQSPINPAVPSALSSAPSPIALVSAIAVAAMGLLGALTRRPATRRPLAMASSAAEPAPEGGAAWRGAEAFSKVTAGIKPVATVEDIAKILPHRYPFLLVDKVVELDPGKRVVGIKNVTMNEPQFIGHFPDRPIMPGVLMIEAMAQVGGVLCLQPPVSDGTGLFFFAGINGVRWRKPVVPGDTLVMEMELVSFKAKFGIAKMKGKAYVDGTLAVDVEEFTFALAK
eukprot:TRINITY_DN6254_c0_g1_i1.p1 TRINITY_DN6254_c0_g1~~TRINITY_DN6254_c0_g1_i1.p1  ORF type:complete len:305 (+),score=85.35 TRINITY_DN6254_c0_g1_i1:22-915(+)